MAGLDELAAGLTVLELDLGAGDVVFLRRRLPDGNHLETNDRPPLATDELHDLVEIHVDDIDDVAFGPLSHANDAVFLRQPTVTVGSAARNDLRHGRVAILALQRGPDAVELEPHPDLEVLEGAGGHEARVGVEGAGEAREIRLEELVGRHLVHPLGKAAVAARELVLGLLGGRLVHFLDEEVVLDPLPPVVDRLRLALGPFCLVAVDDDRFVLGEIERLGEKLLDQRDARVDSLEKPLEDLVGEGDVSPLDEIVEHLPLLHEAVDVTLEKIDLHRVEGLEEDPKPAARDLVVDRVVGEVLAFDVALHGQRDLAVVRPRLGGRGGSRCRSRVLGEQPPEGEQCQSDKQPPAEHRRSSHPSGMSRCRPSVPSTFGRIVDRGVHAWLLHFAFPLTRSRIVTGSFLADEVKIIPPRRCRRNRRRRKSHPSTFSKVSSALATTARATSGSAPRRGTTTHSIAGWRDRARSTASRTCSSTRPRKRR